MCRSRCGAWGDEARLGAGRIKGRENAEQITGFVNNIGLGVQFAAVGAKVFEAAKEKGLGREVPTGLPRMCTHDSIAAPLV